MTVDVCLINYKTAALTFNAARSFLLHTPNCRIYIVDNNSPDDSFKFLESNLGKISNVCLIQAGVNLGYGKGCNLAAEKGNSPFIVFSNSDVEVTKNWWGPLERVLNKERVFAVGPKLINKNNQIMGCGVMGTNSNPILRGWLVRNGPGVFDKEEECVSLSGALFAVNRSLFDGEVGKFDVRYRHYFEDTDLCYRARSKNFKTIYSPDSTCLHFLHGSCKDHNRLSQYFIESKKIFESTWGPTT